MFVKSRLQAEGHIPKNKIRVIHNGVDLNRFYPAVNNEEKINETISIVNQQSSIPLVTFAGALDYNKGVDVLLDAIEQLRRARILPP